VVYKEKRRRREIATKMRMILILKLRLLYKRPSQKVLEPDLESMIRALIPPLTQL